MQTAPSGAPALGRVLALLRGAAPALQARGVGALWVFGSVARGQAQGSSDVDLFAEFDAAVGLVALASLRGALSALLDVRADLVARGDLLPAVRAGAERDAVRVW
jgi:predicted nucleotidyltransferase